MRYLYPFLIASPALLSFQGVLPLWLLFTIFNRFYSFFKGYKFVFLSWLSYLPLLALISYCINFNQSKIGHLIAYFTIFIFAIPSLVSYFTVKKKKYLQYILELESFFSAICICLFLIAIVDYFLLFNNFDYSVYIPAHVNIRPIMLGIGSRARGFWSEPTDLGMAANSFFSFYAGIHIYTSNLKRIKRSFKLLSIFIAWFIVLLLTTSGSAFSSLALSLIILFFINLVGKKIHLKINLKTFIYYLITLFLIGYLLSLNDEILEILNQSVLAKSKLDLDNPSVAIRLYAWISTIRYFYFDANLLQWFIGSGPGNNSLMSQVGTHPGSLSWVLSVLSDLGLIGILTLSYIIYKLSNFSSSIPADIKPYYFIMLTTLMTHLITMTGFYLPVLPVVFSIPIIFRYLERSTNTEYLQKNKTYV